jgi:pantetheine-phosphate adenylyltransferase
MKRKAVYAGTFDPFTNGHDDILKRSLNLFDEVTVLLAVSPSKKPLFSVEDRLAMLNELFKDEKKVNVDSWEGLLVDYAKQNSIGSIIRGLRPTGDFEFEFQMASMNKNLYPEIETVFLMTEGQNYFISSSLVKEVYNHDGNVKDFLPPTIYKWLLKN